MAVSTEQLAIIREQLGREPRGIVKVAASSADGTPLVLQMRSLVDDQPFPTLYWLCSKKLCKTIGQIEGEGWVKRIEGRLQQEAEFHQRYLLDQQHYIARRWQLMHPEDKQRIDTLDLNALFNQYGIGGITQWDKVRCLHMQYAHHLVDGNCIGEMLDREFGVGKTNLVIRP